jgi:signal transduction histidine kinase
MRHAFTLLAAATLTFAGLSAHADTPEDAKALLEAAVTQSKAKGLEATVKDINAGGKWNKGKLYVVIAQFDGTMLAHSANDKIPGKNMLEAKDAAGKAFVKEAIAAAKGSGSAEIPMRWGDPTTKQIADATMFIRRIPGQEAYAGSVVFK